MAIYSHPFGGLTLSGEDAKKFLEYMDIDGPCPTASLSIKRGLEMLKEYKETGRVIIHLDA